MPVNSSCVWIPKAENNQNSKLFQDLNSILQNRRFASFLWGLSKDSSLMKALGINKKDSNGEYLASEILDKVVNGNAFTGDKYLSFVSLYENLNEPEKKWSDAYKRYKEVKATYPELTFSIKSNDSGYYIDVAFNTREGRAMEAQTEFNDNLNNMLSTYLNTLGFKIEIRDDIDSSRTIPVSQSERLAEGFKTVIQIAKGEKGERDLPEEFSHIIIAGLRNTPLVQRLLEQVRKIGVKSILGESYDSYKKLYRNNSEKLVEEAAGKILASGLKGEQIPIQRSFFERLWNFIKSIFSKGKVEDIDSLIRKARELADILVQQLDNHDTINYIDVNNIYDLESMHNLESHINELEATARQALDTMEKRLKLKKIMNPSKEAAIEGNTVASDIESAYNKGNYLLSILTFINYAVDDLRNLNNVVYNFRRAIKNTEDIPVAQLKQAIGVSRDFNTAMNAYPPIFNKFAYIDNDEELRNSIPESEIPQLKRIAREGMDILEQIQGVYNDLTFNTLFKFFEMYVGDDWIIKSETGEPLTLTDIMSATTRDTGTVARLFCAAADSPDPFVTLIDYVIRKQERSISNRYKEYVDRINAAHEKYKEKTGSDDTSFIFHMDEGKMTSMMKSDIDYDKYYADLKKYKEKQKNLDHADELLELELDAWKRSHTEKVTLPDGREEVRPKKYDSKGNPLYVSRELESLNEAQREYYDEMLTIKMELDALIPSKYVKTHKAPQVEMNTVGEVLSSGGTTKQKVKQIKEIIKRKFIRNDDDLNFGQSLDDEIDEDMTPEDAVEKAIFADFDDTPLYRVPLNYIRKLKGNHLENMSTDYTRNMLAYASMALHFDGMSQIADVMELAKDFNDTRKLKNKNKNLRLVEKYRRNGRTYKRTFSESMRGSNSSKVINSMINRRIYGVETQQMTEVGKVSKYKVLRSLLGVNSLLGLGWSILTSTGAFLSGAVQIIIEGLAGIKGGQFNTGNTALGIVQFNKNLLNIISDSYTGKTTNKVTALFDYFNIGGDYKGKTLRRNYRSSKLLNFLGDLVSPMAGLRVGDYMLRANVMLSYLNNFKVIKNGEIMSLYNAIEFKKINNEDGTVDYLFDVPEYVYTPDGKEVSMDDIRERIVKLDNGINGAFTQADKGTITDYILGQFVMQFRTWMPAMLSKRFLSKRFNALMGHEMEGYYVTVGNYLKSTFKDLWKGKWTVATNWRNLTDEQKLNMKRAIAEMAIFWVLYSIGQALQPNGDDDEKRTPEKAYVEYLIRRVTLELGALTITPYMLNSFTTLLKSPLPAVNSLDSFMGLFDVFGGLKKIESGTYAGWPRIARDLYYLTPLKNFRKNVAFINGDYTAFNIFNM